MPRRDSKKLSKERIKTLGKDSQLCLNSRHQVLLERGCPYNTQDSSLNWVSISMPAPAPAVHFGMV